MSHIKGTAVPKHFVASKMNMHYNLHMSLSFDTDEAENDDIRLQITGFR